MKIKLQSAILFIFISIYCFSINGYEITVLKSKNIEPYNLVTNGFKSTTTGNISEFIIPEISEDKNLLEKKIREHSPDIVFTIGTDALIFASKRINDIPLVYSMAVAPEKHIKQFKDITGVNLLVPITHQVKHIRIFFPDVKKIGVLYNPDNTELNTIPGDVPRPGRTFFIELGYDF